MWIWEVQSRQEGRMDNGATDQAGRNGKRNGDHQLVQMHFSMLENHIDS